MLMNQVLYTIVDDIKRIIKVDCSIWNFRGRCIASTSKDVSAVEKNVEALLTLNEVEEVYVTEDTACFLVREEGEDVLVFAMHEMVDNVMVVGNLCVNQITSDGAV